MTRTKNGARLVSNSETLRPASGTSNPLPTIRLLPPRSRQLFRPDRIEHHGMVALMGAVEFGAVMISPLVLLCHKFGILAESLATWTPVELSCEQLCNGDSDA